MATAIIDPRTGLHPGPVAIPLVAVQVTALAAIVFIAFVVRRHWGVAGAAPGHPASEDGGLLLFLDP